MGSQAITAGIFGVIVLVLAFILYTPLVNGMDGLILYWSDSCAKDGQRFVRAYIGAESVAGASISNVYDKSDQRYYGSGGAVVASGSDCDITDFASSSKPVPANPTAAASASWTANATTATASLYNERGQNIGTLTVTRTQYSGSGTSDTSLATIARNADTHALSGSPEWTSVPSLMTQFGGIGKLILSVMPIVVLVTYLGTAGMGLVEYGRGLSSGGIVNAVGGSVLSLIIQVVILQVLPTVLDAIVGSARVTGGQYTVTSTFSSVINIVFAAIPILLVVALLGTSGFQFQRKLSKFRGSGAMNMMGG